MTIKEMIKKVNTANEIAFFTGTEKFILTVQVGQIAALTIHAAEFRSFKKELRENLIDELSTQILNYDGFEFDEDREFVWHDDIFNYTATELVTIRIETIY